MNLLKEKIISVSILGIKEKKKLKVFLEKLREIKDKNNLNNIIIHVDVMDEKFVSNKGVQLSWIKDIKEYGFFADVHLMVEDVQKYTKKAVLYGADSISIHYELEDIFTKIDEIKSILREDMFFGIAIKPKTEADVIKSVEKKIDYVIVMSVEPGLGGQKYLTSANLKMKKLKDILIEVDGGVNIDTIKDAKKSGCDIFVVGTYLTQDFTLLQERILKLEEIIK